MSALGKKHRTDGIKIVIEDKKPRLFLVPTSKAQGLLELISDFEIKNTSSKNLPKNLKDAESTLIHWRDAFKDILEEHGEAGAVLLGARAKANLTQVELAKLIGTKQSDISNMEKGRRPIGKKMAKKLAKILKTNYRVFL